MNYMDFDENEMKEHKERVMKGFISGLEDLLSKIPAEPIPNYEEQAAKLFGKKKKKGLFQKFRDWFIGE